MQRIHLLEALSPLGNHLPDSPAANNSKGLALELQAHELLTLPFPLFHGNVRLRNASVGKNKIHTISKTYTRGVCRVILGGERRGWNGAWRRGGLD